MKNILLFTFFLMACGSGSSEVLVAALAQEKIATQDNRKLNYAWLSDFNVENTLVNRIAPPANFERISYDEASFSDWLRHIPLKPGKPNVLLYNGALKSRQNVHAAVIDLDVGTKDLQQCADAVMRLRAEYLWSAEKKDAISFNFTSGDACKYKAWKEGFRPVINGNAVQFKKQKNFDDSYDEFKNYMQMVFNYCGTASLSKELETKTAIQSIAAGDIFIQGGFPGHAVMVMDVAQDLTSGERIFLLAQSYMPAQEMHILKNFNDDSLSPWFSVNFVEQLKTPEWIFKKEDLKQF